MPDERAADRSVKGPPATEPRRDPSDHEIQRGPDRQAGREREEREPQHDVEYLLTGGVKVTVSVLVGSAVLFLLGRLWNYDPSSWAPFTQYLQMVPHVAGNARVTVADEPWRLLTAAVLHAGFLHLFFNAWWIWDLGRAIEMRRGPLAFTALVVGSAVTTSAVQWLFTGWGVGLSGVVYALAAFLFTQRRTDPVAAMLLNAQTTRFLSAWLVLGVVLSELHAIPMGNWAHAAGVAWGLAVGFAVRSRRRSALLVGVALATAALVLVVMSGHSIR